MNVLQNNNSYIMQNKKNKIFFVFSQLLFTILVYSQEVDFTYLDNKQTIEARAEILVSQMTVEEKISQLTHYSDAIQRLKVPDYNWWNEALHGVARNGEATVFMQSIGLGATFDPILSERIASAISTEARAKFALAQKMGNHSKFAGLTFWSPNVNIFRDPRWGRGQETYGEDPFLTSKIGVGFVKGMQGNDPNYLKTAACAKHYAVHSGPESVRLSFQINPSKQDLFETYLPAFEALVKEAKVEGVMAAYNGVYGKPLCASEYFLQDILRDNWGFDGYITSDCGAVSGVALKQKFVGTQAEAAAVSLKAGTNMNCGGAYRRLNDALDEGLITEGLIHERTVQLYKTRFRLGMFDDSAENPYLDIGIDKIHCDEHIALAREAAQKSIVLLKNKNNVLPLSKNIKVPYLTGPFANSADVLLGSYYGVSSNLVTILEGITKALAPGTSLNYRSGVLPFQENINPESWAPNVAKESDVTICVVGLSGDREGEGLDAIASEHRGDRYDLTLPKSQIDYIHNLVEKKKGPLVMIIASGSPISLEGVEEFCDAILQIWYPGEQGGNAVADVLFGNVSPSGHLPVTFPKNVEQLPSYESYSMEGRTYKYMTKEPMYPFGFGLTYSKIELNNLYLSDKKLKKNTGLYVNIEVSNTGKFDIEEVIQLYISPVDTTGGLPLKSLKGFKRVELKKGEKKNLRFELTPELLKVVNIEGEKVWRKGMYKIFLGNASPGDLSLKLGAALPKEAMIELE